MYHDEEMRAALNGDVEAKVPPSDLVAEKAVLGAVFIKPAAFTEIAGVLRGGDDFMQPAHREIFEAMGRVHKLKRPLDVVEVADDLKTYGQLGRLEGGISYLNDLANGTPTAENATHYARIVREKATLRMLIATAAEIQSSAYGAFGDYHEFVSEAVRKVSAIAMTDKRRTRETLEQTAEKLMNRMEKVQLGQIVSRIPTGISKLDRLMRGGMARGHLIVPCGLTSMGKSSWAFQVAFRGAEQRHVYALIFSLEMSREEALIKGASSLSKVGTEIFQNLPGEEVDSHKVNEIMSRAVAQQGRIRIEEHRSIGEIVAVSHAWHAELPPQPDGSPPPAMIVVDHLQKVVGVRSKNGNRQEEVWGVAQDLKNLAKDLEVPVVAPAQLDNDAAKEKRAPRIGDIRDSKAIEHEADVVLGIHRNRLEAQGRCEQILLKHRGGRVGKRTVMWEGEWQGFEDPANDDVPADDDEP